MNQNVQETVQEQKPSDKELNFRKLEEKYKRELANERSAREEAERKAREAMQAIPEDDDNEPYVNDKKLEKKLSKFGQQTKEETRTEIQKAVSEALEQERQKNWIKQNPDFYEVMQHAEKFANHDPELAETILNMPEGFERQKLVYKNIKALGIDKPQKKEPTIQDKIEANKKNPYYQPSGIGTAPYSNQGDFSPKGKKEAYDKMQELKNRLRI